MDQTRHEQRGAVLVEFAVLIQGDVHVSRSVCEVTGPDGLTEEPPVTPADPTATPRFTG